MTVVAFQFLTVSLAIILCRDWWEMLQTGVMG